MWITYGPSHNASLIRQSRPIEALRAAHLHHIRCAATSQLRMDAELTVKTDVGRPLGRRK
jgi:hypothetical protein